VSWKSKWQRHIYGTVAVGDDGNLHLAMEFLLTYGSMQFNYTFAKCIKLRHIYVPSSLLRAADLNLNVM